jgi:uncharacterized protein (TIGR02145 family)
MRRAKKRSLLLLNEHFWLKHNDESGLYRQTLNNKYMFQKTTKFKAIIQGFFMAGLFLVIMSFFIPGVIWAYGNLMSGYLVSNVASVNIDHIALCGVPCKTVTVSGGRTYFVPTLHCYEWDMFRLNKPADVTTADCGVPACSAATTCGQTCAYQDAVYRTVVIGSQCWFKDDLQARQFPDTSPITQWNYGVDGSTHENRFGCTGATNNCPGGDLFYQSLAAIPEDGWLDNPTAPGKRGSCPVGWRVPSEADMGTFNTTVSSCSIAGFPYDYTASCLNDTFGFNATAYGLRNGSDGNNYYVGQYAYYLMSNYTIIGNKKVYSFAIASVAGGGCSGACRENSGSMGYSVRCIKNIGGLGGGGSQL